MKPFRSLSLYLSAALLIGGYIYFFERGPVKDKEEEKTVKVLDFVADDVQGIIVESLRNTLPARAGRVEIRKDDKGIWQILAPQRVKADEDMMRSVLTGVESFKPEAIIENPATLADYGLAAPSLRAIFKLKNGTSHILLVGGKNAVGTSTYVRMGDRTTVYMIPSSSLDNYLKTKLEDYRNREILRTDTVTAKKITLSRSGSRYVWEKDSNGDWNLTAPIHAKADIGKVRDLLTQMNGLRVARFADDHPAGLGVYGLSSPRVQVEIWPNDGGPSRAVLIGKEKDRTSTYLKDRDLPYVYEVGPGFEKSLDLKLEDLIDKGILKFAADSAAKLTVGYGRKYFTFQKDEKGEWRSEGRLKASEEGPNLVALLSQTAISGFPGKGANSGLKTPTFTAEVSLGDGTTRKYLFGNQDKDKIYVTLDKSRDVYLVAANPVSQMKAYFLPVAATSAGVSTSTVK